MAIYWGDIHGHTKMCDGVTEPEEYYTYARRAGLDFCAITTHDLWISDENWEYSKRVAKKYNDPGKFITLLAYEWTSRLPQIGMARRGEIEKLKPERAIKGRYKNFKFERTMNSKYNFDQYGHKNIYYPTDDAPIFRCVDDNADTPEKLYRLVDNEGGLVISHHAGQWAYWIDWDTVDNKYEPVVEIYSTWGNSEMPVSDKKLFPLHFAPNTKLGSRKDGFVQDALAKGFRLGFIASGDVHLKPPGVYLTGKTAEERKGDYYPGGIVAIEADELSRESILTALRKRRCFAATGSKIEVSFRINGQAYTEEVRLKDNEAVIEFEVKGTSVLKTVKIIKNNKVCFTHYCKGENEKGSFTDKGPPENTYYYIRVIQADGNMAWSSPMWIAS